MSHKIRVLIVDDSVLIRQMLKEIFAATADIEVAGVAADPLIARDKIKQLNPDVLTLDVEMPNMNGLQFLRNLMRLRPMPVVMVSTLTEAGAPATLDALEVGAVDYLAKPQARDAAELDEFAAQICAKVRMAARARVQPLNERKPVPVLTAPVPELYSRLVAIGASTGGTEAIRDVLSGMPAHCPAMVITQHIPPVFSASLANRLNRTMAMEVCEADDGLEVRAGRVIIARGDYHLGFERRGERICCRLSQDDRINRHRPSVDYMFDALAAVVNPQRLLAVILTGMGADGAQAMLRLQRAGARTLAQDEASSVVWGMPGAAWEAGAVERLLPLHEIGGQILQEAR